MSSEPASSRLVVLRHPDLRRFLSARFIVSIATQIQTVAVGGQIFSVSGDPFDLGLVALSQFLPFVVLILPAGHVADRYDRRRVQLLTYVLLAVCAAALLILAMIGVKETEPVFAVMVVYGIARAFNHPTGQALLPNLAPIALFPRAIAVHSSLGQVATILFGVSTSFVLSLAALVVMGAGDMVSVYIRHLLVQLETPDAIRGRVSAVNSVFIGASNELGEFESGLTAAWWGIVPAVVAGGVATLAVAVAWTRLFPGMWHLDRFPQSEDAAGQSEQPADGR